MTKERKRELALKYLPFAMALAIKLIYFTARKRFHLPQQIPDEPTLFVFWHGDLLFQPFFYQNLRKAPKAKVIISEHFDGQVIAKMATYLGLGSIHGSSTRNGAKVLIAALKTMRDGEDLAITPDGPKGPRHEVKDGVVMIAQKAKAKIVVLSCVPKRCWRLKSWDRFSIAKPFTTLDFYASEALDISDMDREEAKAKIEELLLVHDY